MASKVLVVGSGVIGLRTALELLRRNIRVALLSPRHPLHPTTCSMGAGGLWMPFHCDDVRTDGWSFDTLAELMTISKSVDAGSPSPSNQDNRPLVEVLPAVSFKRDDKSPIPGWAMDAKSQTLSFRHLSLDELYEASRSQKFRLPQTNVVEDSGYSHAWLFQTPIIDCPRMLANMLGEITSNEWSDVDVETNKYYASLDEMVQEAKALGCNGLINCTGLGSKQLCADESLVGARGVLLHYDRDSCAWVDSEEDCGRSDSVILIEEPPFGTEATPCYMIPRGDIVAVGGTYLEGDKETSIRTTERGKILENARRMGIDTSKSPPVGEWVGFRPYRPTCRLEVDQEASLVSGVKVVHSYGYGGSGWTVFVGAAREAASLMET